MIAPLLPVMAEDFHLAVRTVALLVVMFTLLLALSSRVTTVAIERLPRRQVLLTAMSLFAIGNLTAALSSSFALLMGARVLMAIGAVFMFRRPTALPG